MTPFNSDRTPLQRLLWLGGMARAAGKAVEDTATGNPLSFVTDLARPLSRLALSLLPRQSGTGDPSPSNIRPLLPWGEVGTWTGGKNLLDPEYRTYRTNNIDYYRSGDIKKTLYPGTYTLSCSEVCQGIYAALKDGTTKAVSYNQNKLTFTLTQKEEMYFVFYKNGMTEADCQLEVGEQETAFTPYTPITPYPVDLTGITPPVYGCELDLTTGEVWGTYYPVNITPQEVPSIYIDTVTQSLVTIYVEYAPNEIPSAVQGTVVSNRFSRSISPGNAGRMVQGNRGVYLVLPASEMSGTDKAAIREWFENNPSTLVFELTTPVLLATLTPQQISAIVGVNTVWSDADNVDLTYLKKG